MSRDAWPEELLGHLRLALAEAAAAAPDSGAEDEDAISPRAAAANRLSGLAASARDAYWEAEDDQGETACALLSDICFYVVDPELRDTMLALAGDCIAALEAAYRGGSWEPNIVEVLQHRFAAARPADDDAGAIARALGMSDEEAAAFGLTGHIATVGLDDDEPGDRGSGIDDPLSPSPSQSLQDLFRSDAREMVTATIPRALQQYWQDQDNMEALLGVRRAFHTLKGDAAVTARDAAGTPAEVELTELSRLAEAAEDIVDELLGEDHDGMDTAPALPAGAFGLLNEVQAHLAERLAARAVLPGEDELLLRLQAMQGKARARRLMQDQEGDFASAAGAGIPPAVPDASTPGARRPTHHSSLTTHHSSSGRLLETFLSEAGKLMPDLHRALARLSDDAGDENALIRARVKLHTLKGSAALAGPEAAGVERLSHACEDLFELIEDHHLSGTLSAVPAEVLGCMLDAEDALQAQLDALGRPVGAGSAPAMPALDVDDLIERLGDVRERVAVAEGGAPPAATAEPPRAAAASTEPGAAAAHLDVIGGASERERAAEMEQAPRASYDQEQRQTRREGIRPLPELAFDPPASSHAARAAPAPRPPLSAEEAREEALQSALASLEEQQVSRDAVDLLLRNMAIQAVEARRASDRLRDLVERVERELSGLRLELVKTTRRSGEWDALEKEEYTAIDVLLMQLDEALADQQEAEALLRRDLGEARAQTEAQADMLLGAQRALLNMSMVPLSGLEARLDHAVRSVARRLNKTVTFAMDGGAIALESRIAESLYNPLMLLINNAVDHGIEERVSDRNAAGKPPEGHITVRGRGDGDSVTIEISDDGRGIDPDRVVAVAVNKGLVDAQRAAAMTRDERIALIWQAGFSTARQVGAISGRGMGMKSVLDDIAGMQGRIEVRSEPGRGTTFAITLPRSLSMLRVQVVREGPHIVALPISDLASTHAIRLEDIQEVPGGRVIRIGPRTLSVYQAHLSAGPDATGAAPSDQAVMLELFGREGGIIVDEVLFSQYLPVRPAPAYLRRSCGLIGYALGAGGIIMPILDIGTVIGKATPSTSGHADPARPAAAADVPSSRARRSILVVDDSQTMRRALAQTFGKAGFAVGEASNGREALTAIARAMPDVITLDMEMPGMDGLETLSALRLLPGGGAVPVFMITSRQQARHRAAALVAGVTRYFTKPYDEDELVGAARLALAGGLASLEAAS